MPLITSAFTSPFDTQPLLRLARLRADLRRGIIVEILIIVYALAPVAIYFHFLR